MNPQPTTDWLASIYSLSCHNRQESTSLSTLLAREVEYPNASVDSQRLIGISKRLLDNNDTSSKALDIGSGNGFYSKAALDNGFKVTAINPGKWENNIFEEQNGFRPIEAFFEDVNLNKNTYELVILSQVLEHIANPQKILHNIRQLIAENGVLAIAVPNVDSLFVKIMKTKENGCLWVPEHLTYFSSQGLKSILERSGFKIQLSKSISRIPYFILSDKLKLTGFKRKISNYLVKSSQILPLKMVDLLGFGMMHNIWARPSKA